MEKLKTQMEELKQEPQQLILNRHRPTCIVWTDSVRTRVRRPPTAEAAGQEVTAGQEEDSEEGSRRRGKEGGGGVLEALSQHIRNYAMRLSRPAPGRLSCETQIGHRRRRAA
jgi:hypothetical protein